jgi:alkylated DNA repair protein (DNA oxidative demethylase)
LKNPISFDGKGALDLNGVAVLQGCLDSAEQADLLSDIRSVVAAAPLTQYETTRGGKLSVRMTAAGTRGWVSDRRGYCYAPRHPSGVDWPPIPARLLALWQWLLPDARAPECCLINYYGEGARMGLHQDRDEADFDQPVLSLSLGDDGLFRVGGTERGGPTRSVWLRSGDAAILAGPARLAYHGVDRIRFGSSPLLAQGGRLNLTLRVVT